jgi:hypothetical protein
MKQIKTDEKEERKVYKTRKDVGKSVVRKDGMQQESEPRLAEW